MPQFIETQFPIARLSAESYKSARRALAKLSLALENCGVASHSSW